MMRNKLATLMRGENGFGNIVYGAVGLVIFLILISSVVMPTIMNANTTGWTTSVLSMWNILPIVVIASAILFVIGKR
jgi:hypothetical protein